MFHCDRFIAEVAQELSVPSSGNVTYSSCLSIGEDCLQYVQGTMCY
jgi:hypothetical protein